MNRGCEHCERPDAPVVANINGKDVCERCAERMTGRSGVWT